VQQNRGPRPFDTTTRLLIDSDPAGWLRWIGLPVNGPVRPIESDVSTVLAEVDKVLRVDGPSPWLAHLELQSSHDRTLPIRMLQYHSLLLRRHESPVESTVILLRRQADGPELSGRFEQRSPRGRLTIAFEYEVVRLWQRPVEELLNGSLGLVPLAPLANLGDATLPDVIAQIDDRLERDAPTASVGDFWANTRILMGLRYDREQVNHVLRRVREMRESETYQDILEEGRIEGVGIGVQQGRAEGRIEGERRLLLRFAAAKLGAPTDAIRARLNGITDLDTLERLAERVLTATTWEELLDGAE
jgi:predicted transposase YdaD